MEYIVVLICAVLSNIFFQKIFLNKNIIDKVNHRSSHSVTATRTGGIVLYMTLFIYTVFLYLDRSQPYDFSIFIPISILFVTGLYDDIYNVDFGLKFIFQIIAAKILIDLGFVIDVFSIFGYQYEFERIISQLVSIFIYLSLFNAYNFIDGIDLNIHLETIKNFIILVLIFNNSSIKTLILFSIIVMCVNAFFNFSKKKKVFMGDSGSLIIPILLIIFIFEGLRFSDDQNVIKYLSIIFVYPIIDLIRVVFIRVINKKSPFKADKSHLHHLLEKFINNHAKTSSIIVVTTCIIQLILYKLLIN